MHNADTVLVIDSNSLIHRSYHALPELTTSEGTPVQAVYGFVQVLLRAVTDIEPSYIAASFDVAAPTFREDMFAEYKAQRPETPDDLAAQIPLVKQVLEGFSVPVYEKEGYEADDVIGTIARRVPEQCPRCTTIVASGDLDTLQLIDEHTLVYTLRKSVQDTVEYDKEAVRERFGITPGRMADYKALRGDPSDNIPGVPGIGDKTAAQLLQQYGTLEALYERIEQETADITGAQLTKLTEHKDQAFFSKTLATIRRDVPIDFSLEECRWQGVERQEVKDTLRTFEFEVLLERFFGSEEKQQSILQ